MICSLDKCLIDLLNPESYLVIVTRYMTMKLLQLACRASQERQGRNLRRTRVTPAPAPAPAPAPPATSGTLPTIKITRPQDHPIVAKIQRAHEMTEISIL